jgi:hypothetical protein
MIVFKPSTSLVSTLLRYEPRGAGCLEPRAWVCMNKAKKERERWRRERQARKRELRARRRQAREPDAAGRRNRATPPASAAWLTANPGGFVRVAPAQAPHDTKFS